MEPGSPPVATALAALAAIAWSAAALALLRGGARIGRLADSDPVRLPRPAPRVTVVVAARDEAPHIAAAMRSLLGLAYPALEVIAVDDRSSDGTGDALRALAAADLRLTVLRVDALPAGWLGKNHALDLGARRARGEWVLFTDADVHFAPDALDRAVAHAEAAGLDHLVLGPRTVGGTLLLRIMVTCFALGFALGTRPWHAGDPARAEHVGIGAFNLVRRRTLAAIGFLERLPLRPDDDVKLGKALKAGGARQGFLAADAAVTVEWYGTAGAMVRGLEKNSFPFLEYSVPRTLAATAAIALVSLWPPLALALTSGWAFALNLAAVALALALHALTAARALAQPPALALGYPLGAALMAATLLNSMARTLLQGGVRWRGTLYPLAALKANRL